MFHQLKLSVGAIVRAVHQSLPRTRYGVARQAEPEVDEALERIRCSPVVHADETGWRENGKNGCVWNPGRGRGQALLRDIHALKALYPEDAVLARWAHGAQRLYAKAREWAAAGRLPPRGQLAPEERLLALCRPFLEDPLAVQAKL